MEKVKIDEAVIIRPMREEDIDGVLALDSMMAGGARAVTYQDPYSTYLGGNLACSFVAEVRGRIVGFLLGRVREAYYRVFGGGWIEVIGVEPEFQHQGIGRRLVEAFLKGCCQEGVTNAHMVLRRDDQTIEGFLRALGFQEGELTTFQRGLADILP